MSQFGEKMGAFGMQLLASLPKVLSDRKLREFGRICGRAGTYFAAREIKILDSQLKFAKKSSPELRGLLSESLFRDLFTHLGESVAENLIQKKLLTKTGSESCYPDLLHIEQVGQDVCRKLATGGRAYLAMSGHLGNFELLGALHGPSISQPTVVGREPNYSFLSKWIHRLRTGYGAEVLLRPDEHSSHHAVSKALIKAFRGTSVIALLPDQDTALESEFAPFFGLDAAHPAAPIRLAVRYRVPVMTSFIYRVAPFQFRTITEELHYNPEGPNPEREILTEYNRRLQRLVELHPEQYLWFHRRWRRRPGVDYTKEPDQLRSTKSYVEWIAEQEPEK